MLTQCLLLIPERVRALGKPAAVTQEGGGTEVQEYTPKQSAPHPSLSFFTNICFIFQLSEKSLEAGTALTWDIDCPLCGVLHVAGCLAAGVY